jgi:hypothetical protein
MKTRKKLAIAVAAMIASTQIGGPALAAAPTADQLATIQSYVSAGDYDALAAFLAVHPELMEAQTGFARELRSFVAAHAVGAAYSFAPSTLSAMERTLSRVAPSATGARGAAQRSSLY